MLVLSVVDSCFSQEMQAMGIETFSMAQCINGKLFMQILAYSKNELPGVLLPCGFRRLVFSVLPVYLDPLFYCLAEFPVNLGFIISMNTTEHQSGPCADVAVIIF